MSARGIQWVLCVLLLAGTSGCTLFQRKPKAPPPPPTPEAKPQIVVPPAKPVPQPKVLEEPQTLPPPQPLPPEPTVIKPKLEQAPLPKPPAPVRRKPKPAATTAPKPKPATEPPAVEPPPPPPVPAAKPDAGDNPRLGDVMPESQRRSLLAAIDDELGAARRALAALQNRRLTQEQSEAQSRIRSFVKQAEESRDTNLTVAAQYARRAAVLSRDLLESLR